MKFDYFFLIFDFFSSKCFFPQFYSDPLVRKNFLLGKQSNLIFLDLLFKQAKYAAVLNHFDILKEYLSAKQLPIIRSIYILVFATCYCQVNFERKKLNLNFFIFSRDFFENSFLDLDFYFPK